MTAKEKLAVFGVLAPSGAFIIWLSWIFVGAFGSLSDSIKAAVIGASAAFLTLIFTFWKERSRAFKEVHREKKIEVYSIFFDMIFDLMKSLKEEKPVENFIETPEFKEKMFKLMKGVVFYGSPNVVNAYSAWTTQIPESVSPPDASVAFRAIGRLLLAMREDIGLSNRGITEISIHQVYVNEDLGQMGFS